MVPMLARLFVVVGAALLWLLMVLLLPLSALIVGGRYLVTGKRPEEE